MKLSIIYPEKLPDKKARAISVLNTARSIAKLCHINLFCEEGSDCYAVSNHSNLNCMPVSKTIGPFRSNKIFNFNLSKNEMFKKSDIFYVRHLKTADFLLRKRPEQSKIIFECHEIFHFTNPNAKQLERTVIENANGLTFINRTLQKVFNETFRISHIPQQVVDNGCGFQLGWQIKDYVHLDTMVYVGSFQPWKGLNFLIEAMTKLPNMRLIIVGSGNEEDSLKQKTFKLGLDKRIEFLGHKKHEEIMKLLQRPIIAVIPNTVSPFNNFSTPIKLYEYMAASCLIVAPDMPTIQEIVRDGENGFLFHTGEVDSFVHTVQRVVNTDPKKLERISRNAYLKSKDFTWDKRAEKICKFAHQIWKD